jgi:hypothetical protein
VQTSLIGCNLERRKNETIGTSRGRPFQAEGRTIPKALRLNN